MEAQMMLDVFCDKIDRFRNSIPTVYHNLISLVCLYLPFGGSIGRGGWQTKIGIKAKWKSHI